MVQALAARNANYNAENQGGMTQMAEAAYAGQLELVLSLAAHNANLDAERQE